MDDLDLLFQSLIKQDKPTNKGASRPRMPAKPRTRDVNSLQFSELFRYRGRVYVKLTYNRIRENRNGAEAIFVSPTQQVEPLGQLLNGTEV